jgi:DNA-binding transcriptional ArsR family regulator
MSYCTIYVRVKMRNMQRKLTGIEIDRLIMNYLGKLELTATTEMTAKAVGIAWYTAQMHLVKLREEGKVKSYRIGRQNQWILAERVERMKKKGQRLKKEQ